MPYRGQPPNRQPGPAGNIQYVHVPVYIPVPNQNSRNGGQGILPTPQVPLHFESLPPPLMSLDIEGPERQNTQRPQHQGPRGQNQNKQHGPRNQNPNQHQGPRGQNPNQQHGPRNQSPNQHQGPRGQNPNQSHGPRQQNPNQHQGPRRQNPNQPHGPRQQNPNQHQGPKGQNPNQQHGPRNQSPNQHQGPRGQNPNQSHGPRQQNPNQHQGPKGQNPNQQHGPRHQNPNQHQGPRGQNPNQQHGPRHQNQNQHQGPRGQNPNQQHGPRHQNPNQHQGLMGQYPNQQNAPIRQNLYQQGGCGIANIPQFGGTGQNKGQPRAQEVDSSLARLRNLTMSADNINQNVVNESLFIHNSSFDITDGSQIKNDNQIPLEKKNRRPRNRRRKKKTQNESESNVNDEEGSDVESVTGEISNTDDDSNLASSCNEINKSSGNDPKGNVYYRGRGRGRGRRGRYRGRGRSNRGRGGDHGTQISEKNSGDECSDDSEDQEDFDNEYGKEEEEAGETYEDGKGQTSFGSQNSLRGGSRGQGHIRGGRGRGGRGRGGHGRGGRGGSNHSSVENIPRWTSNDSMNDGSNRNRRTRNDSEESEISIEIDENKVFTFLIQKFNGKANYNEFKQKCDLFPADMNVDKWFRKNKRRFKLFEKDNQIHYLSAFYKDASYCVNYTRISGKKRCTDPSKCDYFHICVDFLTNSCHFQNCKFSHSFSDKFNHKRKLKLGLEVFSDNEIAAIVLNRLPGICKNSIDEKACFLPHCPNLHICCKYLIGKCFRDPCNVGHSFSTPHNTWILQIFQMNDWPQKREKFLRQILLFPRLQMPGEGYGYEDEEEEMEENVPVSDDNQTSLLTNKTSEQQRDVIHSRKNRTFPVDIVDTEFLSSVEPIASSENEYGVNRQTEAIPKRKQSKSVPPEQPNENADLIDLMELENADLPLNPSDKQNKDPKETGAIPKRRSAWKDVTPESPERKGKSPAILKLEEENASKKALCSNFIEKKCTQKNCRDLHDFSPRSPYIWQIELYGKWTSFGDKENEHLESTFCSPHMENNCITQVTAYDMCHSVRVTFSYDSSDMSALVFSIDDKPSAIDDSNRVRRLSTKSYSKFPVDKPQGFGTQWRWYFKEDHGQWQPYDTDELQYTLEKKYLDGQKSYLFTRFELQFKYRIDFVKFRQLNLDTHKERKIARKPNCFVPQSDVINGHVPDSMSLPTAPQKPPGWAEWDCAHDFELVEIETATDEYTTVVDMMCETINRSKLNIETLYRIQNKKLWRAYDAKKENMQDGKKDGLNEIEKTLFHGTDSFETCKGICTNNFDCRLSGKNGTVYGEGAYFAKEAKYSNSYTKSGESDKRYMFLAKVLVGSYTKGNSSLKRPPGTGVGEKLYDTCVDNESDPKIYVVFELNQCYPLYLVVYQYNSGISTRPSSIQPVYASSQTSSIRSPTRPSTNPSPSTQANISYTTRPTSLHQSASSSDIGSSASGRQVASPGSSVHSNPYQTTRLSYPSSSASTNSQGSTRVTSPVSGSTRSSSSPDFDRNLVYPNSGTGSNIRNEPKSSPEKTCAIQ